MPKRTKRIPFEVSSSSDEDEDSTTPASKRQIFNNQNMVARWRNAFAIKPAPAAKSQTSGASDLKNEQPKMDKQNPSEVPIHNPDVAEHANATLVRDTKLMANGPKWTTTGAQTSEKNPLGKVSEASSSQSKASRGGSKQKCQLDNTSAPSLDTKRPINSKSAANTVPRFKSEGLVNGGQVSSDTSTPPAPMHTELGARKRQKKNAPSTRETLKLFESQSQTRFDQNPGEKAPIRASSTTQGDSTESASIKRQLQSDSFTSIDTSKPSSSAATNSKMPGAQSASSILQKALDEVSVGSSSGTKESNKIASTLTSRVQRADITIPKSAPTLTRESTVAPRPAAPAKSFTQKATSQPTLETVASFPQFKCVLYNADAPFAKSRQQKTIRITDPKPEHGFDIYVPPLPIVQNSMSESTAKKSAQVTSTSILPNQRGNDTCRTVSTSNIKPLQSDVIEVIVPKFATQIPEPAAADAVPLLHLKDRRPTSLSPAEPYFEYSIYQRKWSASCSAKEPESKASTPALRIGFPSTVIETANAQAEDLFLLVKNSDTTVYSAMLESSSSAHDEDGCVAVTGVFSAIGFDNVETKIYLKVWVERGVVPASAAALTPPHPHTPFISKTIYTLRLFKLIMLPSTSPSPSPSPISSDNDSDSDAKSNCNSHSPTQTKRRRETNPSSSSPRKRHRPSPAPVRIYTPLPTPFTAIAHYTTLDTANSAAARLQLQLTHEATPTKPLEVAWKAKNTKELRTEAERLSEAGKAWVKTVEVAREGVVWEVVVESGRVAGPRNV